MSAISTVFWTFTGAGGHVVAPAAVYGGTYGFLRHVAARFGVQTDFVDITDLNQVRAAMRPETQIVYAETVANPTTAVADLPALAEIAHAHGALLVVDSTMAPPVICRPLEHGVDLVLHSATKYLGGHSDTTGGVVSGAPGLISQIRAVRVDTGGALAPDEAFLLRRGLETLPLRVHRQCSTAMLFAAAVARHPAVRRVDYPGLPGHPGHQTAIRLFDAGPEGTRFGAIVTITPHGGRQAGYELADRLRVGQVATSLGGTHTVVSHVASTTHRQFDDAALAAAGMDPGAVRFSIGLEDAEDLIADVHQALDRWPGDDPPLYVPGGLPRAPGPRLADDESDGWEQIDREQRGASVSQKRKIRVAVVFGGRGPEHAISCASGGTVLACIDRDRYDVVPIGILPDGRWVLTADEPERLAITGGQLPSVEAVAEPGGQVLPWTAAAGALATKEPGAIPGELGQVDVVLPMLHGPFGEDGTMQGLLEMAGVRYVGAGVLASAVSMDKEYMKLIFKAKGLPVGPFVVVRDRDWPPGAAETERKRVLDAIGELGWPLFVKPARGGSSIGTSRADDLAGLHESIETARRYDRKVLVEQAIPGREVECAVLEGLDGAPPDTSMPGQLVVDGGEEFFDFEAKYLDDANRMVIPAPIPADHLEEVRRLAAAAFEAVSGEGLARVDFFYTPDGEIVLNEINTMPGMTAASYFPKMWAASGFSLRELIDRLIATALSKSPGLR